MLIPALAALASAAQAPAAPPAASPPAPPAVRLGRPFEAMEFLVGHCWRGELRAGVEDTHCFERVYGGRFLRDRHEVTGGYSGETLYSWNQLGGAADYTYWNSVGGVSRGTMRPNGDQLDFGDETYRAADGRTMRIATAWQRRGETQYEVRVSSPGNPTGARVTRYTRLDRAPVSVSSSQAPDGRHVLVHEAVVAAPPAEVWQAISTVAGWRSWAVPVAWGPEPDIIETSYTPTARPGDRSTIRQQILAAIPERLLVFRTVRAADGFPDFDTYRAVTSVFELEPAGERATRVRLTGSGYADTDAGRRLLAFFREGNRVSLERLRRRFETGPLDWEAVLARE